MNKSQLIERLAERGRTTKKKAEQIVNLVFEEIGEVLRRGERVEIRGFGSFSTKSRSARPGRNPRTGTTIHVSAKRAPVFKVGKELKERVDTVAARLGITAESLGNDEDDDSEDHGEE